MFSYMCLSIYMFIANQNYFFRFLIVAEGREHLVISLDLKLIQFWQIGLNLAS